MPHPAAFGIPHGRLEEERPDVGHFLAVDHGGQERGLLRHLLEARTAGIGADLDVVDALVPAVRAARLGLKKNRVKTFVNVSDFLSF